MKNLVMFLATISLVGCGHPDVTITPPPPQVEVIVPVLAPNPPPPQRECIVHIRKHKPNKVKCYLCIKDLNNNKFCREN